ncbi:MAG TPA: hypothetical protein DEP84_20525 [Chloroflexi bacterium]|nr:hypothetical protein [Chloroflexota bacterium]
MATTVDRDRNVPLRQQIHEVLKYEILTGSLKAGQVIGEEALADRYGSSRTPVREVLRSLEQEGLVQYYPHRGYHVAEFKLDDVLDVFQVRMMLEPEAASLAATWATPEDMERLEELARENVSSTEAGEASLRFHRSIAELTGNRLLAGLVEQLNERIWLFGRAYLAPVNPQEDDLGHFKIIEALRQGDPEGARDAMREHLEHIRQRLSRRLV